jgi:hypothetical protein
MPVGVTTFIANTLAKGTRFSVGTGRGASKGLSFGRQTDFLVRKVIEARPLGKRNAAHTAATRFFEALAAAKIRATACQVSVRVPELNIRAVIDVVGVDHLGNEVVIELKTTQVTTAEHAKLYYTTCRNLATLKCDLPNCLYWRHQLQCGFGVLARGASRGLVVVVCTDGVRSYKVEHAAMERSRFEGALPTPDSVYAPTLPWPNGADDTLLAALRKRGYPTLVGHNPTVVRGVHGDAVVLLIHKHKTYPKTKAAKGHRIVAKILTATRPNTAALLVWLSDTGTWRVNTLVKRTPAAHV